MAIKGKGERNAPKMGHWIGTYEADSQVRKIIAEMLETAKRNGKDRAQVAKDMSDALGRDVTPVMLAEFTRLAFQPREQNGEKPKRRKRYVSLPTPLVPALSAATGSDKLIRYLMDAPNLELLELAERQHLKFDWVIDRLERLYSRIQNLKAREPRKQRRKRGAGKA
jgi:hypothetical protein